MPLILPSQLIRSNLLAYPAGVKPGFSLTHLAAKSVRFSGVASGGGFVNLLKGTRGTITGAPSFTIDGSMGPAFNPLVTSDKASFAGQSTANDLSMTQAVVAMFNAVTTSQVLFSSASTNNGWRLNWGTTQLRITAGGVVDLNSGIALAANTPYFLVGSANGSASNFLALNLSTGKILTGAASGATPVAPDGTYLIGNDAFNEVGNAKIAAAMFSAGFLSLSEMRVWAADPWSFWYSRQTINLADTVLVPPPVIVTTVGATLPMMGVG